jgi:Asp-tRNA(Asn)/Glu-tRNA(Gln) amidotransferase A subunit family amidase
MDNSVNFRVEEASIADIHAALKSGITSARVITQAFLDRIKAYDRKGPALWAIIAVNPEALSDADALDQYMKKSGRFVGPLHGIPILVKDNYDVAGLQTTGGSASLIGWIPKNDATVIKKLRGAGAIILAKTTMSEWARGGFDNINSVLPTFARNPYNTAHATGGSSGGTAAGLAASFGVVGLGSDTFGSIRNPANNNSLVGLRPSWALISRAGMIGLYDSRDTAGPLARTVTDLVALLDVIVGVDNADPATTKAENHIAPTYTTCLKLDGACGKRIGVLRQAFPESCADPNVTALVNKAAENLKKCGAEIIDPFIIPEFNNFKPQHHPLSEVRSAIESYLSKTSEQFPKTIKEIVESEKYHPLHEVSLKATAIAPSPQNDPIVHSLEAEEIRMRKAYEEAMQREHLDAFILPVASFPPKLNGDRNVSPPGATTWIASGLHWPAAVVPMGYTYEDLPSGLQIVGKPWTDTTLIEIAYAFEQATNYRHPPSTVPPL